MLVVEDDDDDSAKGVVTCVPSATDDVPTGDAGDPMFKDTGDVGTCDVEWCTWLEGERCAEGVESLP